MQRVRPEDFRSSLSSARRRGLHLVFVILIFGLAFLMALAYTGAQDPASAAPVYEAADDDFDDLGVLRNAIDAGIASTTSAISAPNLYSVPGPVEAHTPGASLLTIYHFRAPPTRYEVHADAIPPPFPPSTFLSAEPTWSAPHIVRVVSLASAAKDGGDTMFVLAGNTFATPSVCEAKAASRSGSTTKPTLEMSSDLRQGRAWAQRSFLQRLSKS